MIHVTKPHIMLKQLYGKNSILADSGKQWNVALTMGNRDNIVASRFENGKKDEWIKKKIQQKFDDNQTLKEHKRNRNILIEHPIGHSEWKGHKSHWPSGLRDTLAKLAPHCATENIKINITNSMAEMRRYKTTYTKNTDLKTKCQSMQLWSRWLTMNFEQKNIIPLTQKLH